MKKILSFIKHYANRKKKDLIWWAVLIVAVPVIGQWQTRDLLSKNQSAPSFKLHDIEGKEHSLSDYQGKPVVIYFFAPWCTVCKATSSNINYLRKLRASENLEVLVVGLSYSESDEVKEFVADHKLNKDGLTVLLGDDSVMDQYKIEAFPTFYFIDSKGSVTSTAIGYTTTAGLLFRSL